LEERKEDDPMLIDLVQRVTRLEERMSGVEKLMSSLQGRLDRLEDKISSVDSKTWYVLASVIVGILLTILTRVF